MMLLRISAYYKLMVLPFILILHWLAPCFQATHFRGGIIMVRPAEGGTPAEVRMHFIYNCMEMKSDSYLGRRIHYSQAYRRSVGAHAPSRQLPLTQLMPTP